MGQTVQYSKHIPIRHVPTFIYGCTSVSVLLSVVACSIYGI